jgi:hypothetical protein
MPSLPKLSITAKLYVIFALVAAGAMGLAACAVVTPRSPGLGDRLRSA